MKTEFSCIALDLETTGLDPQQDTIIEIAAVQCTLKYENNAWSICHAVERSMLVHPGCPLSEEVTLITGITDSMLEGKARWHEIQQRVHDFFHESHIIVGHNVFFDIDMLKTHGIDLSHFRVIDTFELAELLSPEAKSLNLGFLGDHYGIRKRGPEHRALTDVWMSIDLLVIYLTKMQSLTAEEYAIWEQGKSRDSSGSLESIPANTKQPTMSTQAYNTWKKSFDAAPQTSIPQ